MHMTPHPVCGHPEYPDRHNASGPCSRCLKQIEREFASDQPHPICGCLKPVWSFRTDGGPCGQCLKDVERAYGLTPDPRVNDPKPTLEDMQRWSALKLEATDWVDINPARVAREPAGWVAAIQSYRLQLAALVADFDGTQSFPEPPARDAYL